MVKVQVECPSCGTMGYIEVDVNSINSSEGGIVTITLAESVICEHSFIAYLDRNLQLRDCFMCDFTIELPKVKLDQKVGEDLIPDSKDLDLYEINMNLYALTFAYILRACFLNKKLIFLNDIDGFESNFANFLNYSFQNSFDISVEIKKRWEYDKSKKKYQHKRKYPYHFFTNGKFTR